YQITAPMSIPNYRSLTPNLCGFFSNNGRWTGVSFKALLQEAQVRKEAKYVDVRGAYDKTVRISLKDIDRKKIFLAYGVNGQTLPRKHGFPLRLVYEDAYGYDWVKYVDEVVVL
ncbi:MAG: molybdopterin-dependent oxidoreductase, partial [Thermodesulfobacteriota bacterium]